MTDAPPAVATRRADALWIVGLWAVLGAIHSPVLAGVVTYFHDDLWSWFLPVHDYLRRELWQGHLLPWCPLVSCGYPLSAEPQTGIFYPLNLLFALPLPITVVMGLALWVHYGIAATGMYALARRLGCSALGSFAAALVFSATGFMVAHLHHFAIVSAAAWFPWVWYAAYSYRVRPKRRYLVLLWWCAAAQLLAGQPQIWLLTFGSVLLWLLLAEGLLPQMKETRPRGAALAARWLLPVAAVALGTALAAITILPMMLLYSQSTRSASTLDFITSYSLSRDTLGSLLGRRPVIGDAGEFEGFAGLTTLLLALFVSVLGKHRERGQWLVAMLIVACFMGLGSHNPLYRLFLQVPLLSGFRCPARWLLIISACLALLAGWGLTELRDRRPWLAILLAGVLACEVIWFAVHYPPVMPVSNLSPPALLSQLGAGRVLGSLPSGLPGADSALRQFKIGRQLVFPNLNLLYGVAAAEGDMPLQLRSFERLRQWADAERHPERAALLGVQHLLTLGGAGQPSAGWDQIGEQQGVTLYRNRYYRGWWWLEQPGAGAPPSGIAYSHYEGRFAWVANCSSEQPNRVVFSFLYGPWLSATVDDAPVRVERTREGLCAVSFTGSVRTVLLRYHHPRLREGLLLSTAALALFVIFMLAINYCRRRPRQA